jgi:hypothetical protein
MEAVHARPGPSRLLKDHITVTVRIGGIESSRPPLLTKKKGSVNARLSQVPVQAILSHTLLQTFPHIHACM